MLLNEIGLLEEKFYIVKQPEDWFRGNNNPSYVRDVIFCKSVTGLFHNIEFHERLLRSFKVVLLFHDTLITI